jgi:hypothetical protein
MAVSVYTEFPITGDSDKFRSYIDKWLSSYIHALPLMAVYDKIMSAIVDYVTMVGKNKKSKNPDEVFKLCNFEDLLQFFKPYAIRFSDEYEALKISSHESHMEEDVNSLGKRIPESNPWTSASKKKKLENEQPTSSWWEVYSEEEVVKASLSSFSTNVENMRRKLVGLTISHDIVIPKNFQVLFPRPYEVILILAKRLEINILEGSIVLDPNTCIWKDVMNAVPINENDLSKIDPKGEIGKAYFHLIEAIDFLLRPFINVESRPGLDVIRHLMAVCLQAKYDRPLSQIEGCCVYSSKAIENFETALRPLFPNIPEFGAIVTSMLRNIVGKITTSDKGELYVKSFEKLFLSLYKKDSAVYSLVFNKQRKRRLNNAGILAQSQKKTLNPKIHYEEYTALIKPSLDIKQCPISTIETTLFRKINLELQVLEARLPLKMNIDQVLRKTEASQNVQILHEKCKKINNHVLSRKNRAHKILVEMAQKAHQQAYEQGRGQGPKPVFEKRPFSTDEWREVMTPIIASDERVILKLVKEEFFTDEYGKISWTEISNKINSAYRLD